MRGASFERMPQHVQEMYRECAKRGDAQIHQLVAQPMGARPDWMDVIQPRLAGHGPMLFAGLSKRLDLKLVGRLEFGSGAVPMRYEPRK